MLSHADALKALPHWPVDVTFEKLLHRYVPRSQQDRFTINVGAQNGDGFDPIYPLLQRGYAGLSFEGDPDRYEVLHKNLAAVNSSRQVHIIWGYLTQEASAPPSRRAGRHASQTC